MPHVITDGVPIKRAYEPPEAPKAKQDVPRETLSESFMLALSNAIVQGFKNVPPPIVNVNTPKPEVKINSPVYVQPPEVKIPATTVNVPDGKAPVVNIEPAAVTLQTNRPTKWHFTFHRDEYGRMTSADAEAK